MTNIQSLREFVLCTTVLLERGWVAVGVCTLDVPRCVPNVTFNSTSHYRIWYDKADLIVLSKECVFLIVFQQEEHDIRQDDRQHICNAVTIRCTVILWYTLRGGFKEGEGGPRPPVKSLALLLSPTARSKVNDAGMLLNYVVIASNVYMWTTFYVYCV